MSCHKFLGFFGHCDDVNTGIMATETGEYHIRLRTPSGYWKIKELYHAGQEIVIPSGKLNESGKVRMELFGPDGYLYHGYDMEGNPIDTNKFEFQIEIVKKK